MADVGEYGRIVQRAIEAGASACLAYLSAFGDDGPTGCPCVVIDATAHTRSLIWAFLQATIGRAGPGTLTLVCADMSPLHPVRSKAAQDCACQAIANSLRQHGFTCRVTSEDAA